MFLLWEIMADLESVLWEIFFDEFMQLCLENPPEIREDNGNNDIPFGLIAALGFFARSAFIYLETFSLTLK
jgi:hypothetical protein